MTTAYHDKPSFGLYLSLFPLSSAMPPRADQLPGSSLGEPPAGEKKKDHFLETVLGAPKAGVNQEPYANTELLHRHRRAPDYNGHHHQHHSRPSSDQSGDVDGPASPSQQLDLSPRIMMRGNETKTRFNGSSVMASLIAQVCCTPTSLLNGHIYKPTCHCVSVSPDTC